MVTKVPGKTRLATSGEELGEQLDQAAADGLDAVRSLLSDHGIVARPESETLTGLLKRDEEFLAWFAGLGLERIGFREIRTALRRRQAMARSAE